MSKKKEVDFRVGVFRLGHINVELRANTEMEGGEFYFCPDDFGPPRIRVGLNSKEWSDVLSWLLHETFEMAFCHRQLRFQRTGKLNGDHADYLFAFDHCEFGNCCSMSAWFLTDAIPVLATCYKKSQKERRRK